MCVCVCKHACALRVLVSIFMCVPVCVHACVCLCITSACEYTHTHTHTHTHTSNLHEHTLAPPHRHQAWLEAMLLCWLGCASTHPDVLTQLCHKSQHQLSHRSERLKHTLFFPTHAQKSGMAWDDALETQLCYGINITV
jgi:hypothetical protein